MATPFDIQGNFLTPRHVFKSVTSRICVLAVFLALILAISPSADAARQEPTSAEPTSTPAAAPAPPALPPTTDPVEIIRRVAAHEEENEKKERNYTYVQDVLEKKLDDKGAVKSTETRSYDVMIIYGEQVERLVAKDDKPLPLKDADKEEEKVNRLIEKYKKETDDQRRKRLEKAAKEKEKAREFVKDIADAFNFTMLPPETLDGRTLFPMQAEPKPNFKPQTKEGKYLTKFRGKVWIDPVEYQWVKVDLELLDTISFGWFVARLHKGMQVHLEQTRVNEEVWLPKLVRMNLDARIALFKNLNYDVTQTYRDYKKFGSQTKITIGDEVVTNP